MAGRYEASKSATVAADGTATVRFDGPGMSFDVLVVDVISLSSTSALLAAATLYRGEPAGGRRLAYNVDGLAGAFDGGGSNDVIDSGESWSVQWTGATAGSSVTASLSGTVTRRR